MQNSLGRTPEVGVGQTSIDSISQPSYSVNMYLGYPMIRITKHVDRLIGDFDYICFVLHFVLPP